VAERQEYPTLYQGAGAGVARRLEDYLTTTGDQDHEANCNKESDYQCQQDGLLVPTICRFQGNAPPD
jgi:hypothetical protein